ncbi:MAG TPA: CHAT domain-containing protein [Cyclobacteriaceae bacterium]|nr:CHAT domain-containing protein [Cyclobacteriaceae bacterium]
MSAEKIYAIKIKVAENGISIIWGGDAPDLKPGLLNKNSMKLELSVTRIFHKVLNRGKRELLEIFEKNDFEVLGNMLFKILLSEEAVRSFLYGRLALITRDQQARCRMLIEFDPNAYDLAALPWEYLLIQQDAEKNISPFFWAADRNRQFDLIRYVAPDFPPAVQPLITESQSLNVILVINNPSDKPIDKTRMISCLKKLRTDHKSFNLYTDENLINPPFTKLKERLTEYLKFIDGPYVLHFYGHAQMHKEQAGIFFNSASDTAEEVKGDDFADLFDRGGRDNFRQPDLVVLQACESGQVGEKGNGIGFLLAKKGIPAVVAMQNEVTEDASENFVREFYLSLLKGDNVAHAVTNGRTFMAINYNKDAENPEEHYCDNTFGAPIVFISSESPFYLLPPQQRSVMKKNSKKCRKCGFYYDDISLDTCIQNGGRCGGELILVSEAEQGASVGIDKLESRPTKVLIADNVPRSSSAN